MKKEFYFLLLCLFLSVGISAQNEGPVVYLPLDTDLTDASGNGYHAVDSGKIATAFVVDEVRGQVAFFDTTAHAALPKVDALRFGPGQDFAFSMWMKIDRLGGDPAILGNKDWNNGRNKGFVMYNVKSNEVGAKNLGINFSDGPSDQGGSHNRLYWETFPNGAPDMIDGTWHFIAASFNRDDTLRVWVDGELQYSVVDMSIAPGYAYDNVKDYPIRIMEDGTGTYNNGRGMKGYIDEVRIWNRTVTNDEIVALYSETNTAVSKIEAASLNTILYPNPANGIVNVKFNSKSAKEANIQVFSNTGSLLKEINHPSIAGQNIASFNVRGWNKGIYLVRVVSDSESDTVRLIVAE
ncbi:MAG: LamG-like jellyroll fold domain-containing protein [Draconibacterium sp.]